MRNKIFLFIVLLNLLQNSSLHAAKILGFGSKDYDVALLASPISVRDLAAGEAVDAIEPGQALPRHVVSFKIERVLIGELAKQKRGGPSRMDQASQAVKDRDYLKLAGLDFKDPNAEVDKEIFRVALHHAGEAFGVMPGENVPNARFKLYLKRISKQRQSYLLVKRELIS